MALNLSEPVHRVIYISGEFETELTRMLTRVVRSGDVFLDIGANVGWHTLNLLKSRRDVLMAYAVEPQQRNFDLLMLGVRANKLETRCDARRLGIASERGKIILKRFQGLDSMHTSVYPLGDLPYDEEEVACETVDGLVSTFKAPPAVIKCDVEGSELSVLQGALETLSGKNGMPPIWFMEANYETSAMAGYFPWDLAGLSARYGYRPYAIRGGGIAPVAPKGLRHGDMLVLAVPEIHGSRLK
ncbi:MAG: FkbM family methyltransferase [Candidatus Sulfotelmatobacter sp.]